MLVGGFFADRVRRHDRVAALGLLVAAALTVPIAMQAVSPALLPIVLALAGAAGGATSPSRDMIVRNATPPGAIGQGVRLRLFRPGYRLVPGAAAASAFLMDGGSCRP